ncbi:MAG: hypothetical protein ABEH64_08795 [Salinirussus sp.]
MNSLPSAVDDASTVLLTSPTIGPGNRHCSALLNDDLGPDGILFVSYTRGPEACAAQVRNAVDGEPAVTVLTVGSAVATEPDGVTVRSLASASDMTGLGIAMSDAIANWSPPIAVCFDSVTSMLQYIDLRTAYQFLHTTTGRLTAAGAKSHFHLDPAAHDDQTIAAITSLFDARIRIDNGQPEIRTR